MKKGSFDNGKYKIIKDILERAKKRIKKSANLEERMMNKSNQKKNKD